MEPADERIGSRRQVDRDHLRGTTGIRDVDALTADGEGVRDRTQVVHRDRGAMRNRHGRRREHELTSCALIERRPSLGPPGGWRGDRRARGRRRRGRPRGRRAGTSGRQHDHESDSDDRRSGCQRTMDARPHATGIASWARIQPTRPWRSRPGTWWFPSARPSWPGNRSCCRS